MAARGKYRRRESIPFQNLSLSAPPNLDEPKDATKLPPAASTTAGWYRLHSTPLHGDQDKEGAFLGTRGLPRRKELAEVPAPRGKARTLWLPRRLQREQPRSTPQPTVPDSPSAPPWSPRESRRQRPHSVPVDAMDDSCLPMSPMSRRAAKLKERERATLALLSQQAVGPPKSPQLPVYDISPQRSFYSACAGSTLVGSRRKAAQARMEEERRQPRLEDPADLRRRAAALSKSLEAAEKRRRAANRRALRGLWQVRAPREPALGRWHGRVADDSPRAFEDDADSESSGGGGRGPPPPPPVLPKPELPEDLLPLPSTDVQSGMAVCIAPQQCLPHWRFAWATVVSSEKTHITVQWRSPPPQWNFPVASRINKSWWDREDGGQATTTARELLHSKLAAYASGQKSEIDLEDCPPGTQDFAALVNVLVDGQGCDYLSLGEAAVPRRSVEPLCRALVKGGGCAEIRIMPPPTNPAWVVEKLEAAAQDGLTRLSTTAEYRDRSGKPRSAKDMWRTTALENDIGRRLIRVALNRRQRDEYQERLERRILGEIHMELQSNYAQAHQKRLDLACVTEALRLLEMREMDERPLGEAARACSLQRLVEVCEEVWRRYHHANDTKGRAELRALSQQSWQDAALAQRYRLARCRRERSALEVEEREGRCEMVSLMLAAQREIWKEQAESSDHLHSLEREKAVREEEELRRTRQKLAEEEREKQWKQERQKAEERRQKEIHQTQRIQMVKEEERFRRQWESTAQGKPGHEQTSRMFIDNIKTLHRTLAVKREKLGVAIRARTSLLEVRPVCSLKSDLEAKVSIFFTGNQEYIDIDQTLEYACQVRDDWADDLIRAEERLAKEIRDVKKSSADLRAQLIPLVEQARQQHSAVGIEMLWIQELMTELEALNRQFDAEDTQPPSPDEILGGKLKLWGGEVRCTVLPDSLDKTRTERTWFPVNPCDYDALRFETNYVTVRHSDDLMTGVSDVSVMLPKDGTVMCDVVSDVIAGLKYKCTIRDHPNAYERRLRLEVTVLVADDAASLPDSHPRRLAQLTTGINLTLVVHPRYLHLVGPNPFSVAGEFEEGQDDKVLLPVPIYVGDPAYVERDESGFCCVLKQTERQGFRPSTFASCTMSISLAEAYTPDDQVYLKRSDPNSPVGIWLSGTEIMMNNTHVGTVVQGTLKKCVPLNSEAHKISAGLRDSCETWPQDYSEEYPGRDQVVEFNCNADADSVHAVLEALRFTNLSADPSEGTRLVLLSLKEASQGHSTSLSVKIQIRGEDDATYLRNIEPRCLFHAALSPDAPDASCKRALPSWRRLCPEAVVDDVDTQFFTGGYLRATLSAGAKPGDSLMFDVTGSGGPIADLAEAPWHYPSVAENPHNLTTPMEERPTSPSRRKSCVALSPNLQDRLRDLSQGSPPLFHGLQLYREPQEDSEQPYKAQVYFGDDLVATATFYQLTVDQVYRQMEEAKEETASLGITLGQPLLGRFKAAQKGGSQKAPGARLKEIPFGFSEIFVEFACVPTGFASIAAAQELIRRLSFRNSLLSPREGPRTIDLELLVGQTIKQELGSPSTSHLQRIRVDPKSANDTLRERLQVRVTQSLLRVPPKHSDFVYSEGSGQKRVAPFEVMPDEEVWVETYSGGFIHVRCTEGCTRDDVFVIRSDEKEVDALTVVGREPPDPESLPGELLIRLLPISPDLKWSLGHGHRPVSHGGGGAMLKRLSVVQPEGMGLQALMSSVRDSAPEEEEGDDYADDFDKEEETGLTNGGAEGEDEGNLWEETTKEVALTLPNKKSGKEEEDGGDKEADAEKEKEREAAAKAKKDPVGFFVKLPNIFDTGYKAIVKYLLEKKGEVLPPGSPKHNDQGGISGGLDILRGDQVIGTAVLTKGECLVCFHQVQPPVRRKEVLQILRNITYCNKSSDPQMLNKVFQFSLVDGSSLTTSTAFVACEVQPVNDPTVLVMETDKWRYRQLASCAEECIVVEKGSARLVNRLLDQSETAPVLQYRPFPLGRACLFDADTNYFDKASLRFELASGGGKHDVFGFLTEKQQLRQFAQYNATAETNGQPRLDPVAITLGERRQEPGGQWEQPLLWNELEIGTLQRPKNSVTQGVFDLHIQMARPTGRRITIGMVSYILNCITYSNTTLLNPPDRASQGTRTFRVRVNDGVNKDEGKGAVMIDFFLPIIQVPGMVCSGSFIVEGTPLPLVQKGLCNLPDKALVNSGFLEAGFIGGQGESDQLLLTPPRNSQYLVKDGWVHHAQEQIGKLTITPSVLRIDFGSSSRNVDRRRLQDLLRMICFSTSSLEVAGGAYDSQEGLRADLPADSIEFSPRLSAAGDPEGETDSSRPAAPPELHSVVSGLSTADAAAVRQMYVRFSEGQFDQDGLPEANLIKVQIRVEKKRQVDRHGREVSSSAPPPSGLSTGAK
eukprot:Hpha_TRINITY_DN13182_c0_g1::TRINITY_DN13182_c0_g1_i1::g.113424::m.113424